MISLYDLNLILQLIIFIFILIGFYYVKRREKSYKKHRVFMGLAVALNAVLILSIMGRSLLGLSTFLLRFHKFGPFITWIHATTGGLAEILGIIFLFTHPRRTLLWMRLTVTLWFIALLFGIIFYIFYYII